MRTRLGIVILFLLCSAFPPHFSAGERLSSGNMLASRAWATTARMAPDTSALMYVPALLYTQSMPVFSHVFVIVLENKEYDSVIGNPDAPYFNDLAGRYGLAMSYYGVTHPSLPNYIALTSGDTFTITSNCVKCFLNVPNIGDQIESAGKTWKAYMESMPRPCFVGNQGSLYAQKHNPFIYYDSIRNDPARCNRIVPFTEFATDLQNDALANYTWITPNMCNSQHDCSVSKGDTWLKQWIPQILASPAWQHGGVLFVTYDEGSTSEGCCGGSAGGRIATLIISPLGKPAFQSDAEYDHYSLLRTIEDSWRMPPLGKASSAHNLANFFRSTP